MLYSCYSLGAVFFLFTAYTERAFLHPDQLFKHPLRCHSYFCVKKLLLYSLNTKYYYFGDV
ncbi:hypothetical protein F8S12_31325 [Nostoc sp. WHI]|nr:hypothetical protein [Nostoc sp. WHI]